MTCPEKVKNALVAHKEIKTVEFDLAEDIFWIEVTPEAEIGLEQIKNMIKECGYNATEINSPLEKNAEKKIISSIPKSLEVYFEKAQQEKNLILIECSTSWCVACKRLHQEIENSPELKEYITKNFIVVHLDIEKEAELAKWLQILGVPDSCIFSSQGEFLGRITGFRNASDYLAELATFYMR